MSPVSSLAGRLVSARNWAKMLRDPLQFTASGVLNGQFASLCIELVFSVG
jgi:hypothetical protein